MKKLIVFLCAVSLSLFFVTAVHATPVVSTLPQTESNSTGVGGTNDYAAGFVWNTSDLFSSADLYLGVEGSPSAGLTVSLYTDVSGSPGSSILALSGPSDPNTPGLYTYTGVANLTSGDTYWLVASTGIYNDYTNEYIWYDGTFGDAGYVDTKWQRPTDGYTWTSSGIVLPAAFQVNSAPVPEPTTWLLLGSGLIGLAGFRKRFRKK